MRFIHLTAVLTLTCGLHAQTAPKPDAPDAGGTLLAPVPADVPQNEKDKKQDELKPPPSSATPENPPEVQKTADEGIQIQVEKTTATDGGKNPTGVVRIYSPWPAKPITPAPPGWKFSPAPSGLTPHRTTVTLGNGNTVDLSITPFVLVPVSDGLHAIRIAEPGYDPSLRFAQRDTVGTMLESSTSELEKKEQQAAAVISRLQQLLSSLPKQTP